MSAASTTCGGAGKRVHPPGYILTPYGWQPAQEAYPYGTPYWAAALRRYPQGAPHGFPHPGWLGSDAGLEPGRDNPFARGGPASYPGLPWAPLQPAGGMSLPVDQARTPEEVADLESPFRRTSVLGLSGNLLPNESQELCRVFTKGQATSIPIWITWSIRPGLDFDFTADTLNARILIDFGAGGAQMSRVAPDVGCGSLPNDGAALPEPTGFGGFGSSMIVHGSFARVIATNTGASPAGHATTIAVMASRAESGRNPQPVYTSYRVALAAAAAAGDATTIGIPPYASHLVVYRTNSGMNGFLVQVLSYIGAVTSILDLVVVAGTQMTEIALPNGAARVNLLNLGPVAGTHNAMFRLNP